MIDWSGSSAATWRKQRYGLDEGVLLLLQAQFAQIVVKFEEGLKQERLETPWETWEEKKNRALNDNEMHELAQIHHELHENMEI